jgi:hypothetical protein
MPLSVFVIQLKYLFHFYFIYKKKYFLCRSSPTRARAASLLRFLDRTQLDIRTRYDSSERVISSSQRLLRTQHPTKTNIHALSKLLKCKRALHCTVHTDIIESVENAFHYYLWEKTHKIKYKCIYVMVQLMHLFVIKH